MLLPCSLTTRIASCKPNGLIHQQEFKAIINITGMDTFGLTNELTKVISNNMQVNIQSISLNGDAGLFKGQLMVVVQNSILLNKLIDNIKKIDGIDKVTRVYKNSSIGIKSLIIALYDSLRTDLIKCFMFQNS
jgi:predicted amino acid-binding ACT domain protein